MLQEFGIIEIRLKRPEVMKTCRLLGHLCSCLLTAEERVTHMLIACHVTASGREGLCCTHPGKGGYIKIHFIIITND